MRNLCVGITMGDPAGIGPEVALRAVRGCSRTVTPVIIGSAGLLKTHYGQYLLGSERVVNSLSCREDALHDTLSLYDNFGHAEYVPGEPSVETGRASLAYIDAAIDLWKNGIIDAIVTGPVHKGFVEKTGIPFMGHTEYFAEHIGEKNPYMMMYSPDYRVLLVTTHFAISKLPERINEQSIYDTIMTGHRALSGADKALPRIAVCGFDPHCGDDGAIGTFDRDVTAAAVARARQDGADVYGPFSADTLFLPKKWKQYDLVIAQYHDQGLIPFKMCAFENGVNVTLGISLVRTSVDHGTAFDIAGKGIAQSSSMVEAINFAEVLWRNRHA